jgi:hypothetical protein
MTTHTTTRPGRPVTQRAAGHYTTRDVTVAGTPNQLANVIDNYRRKGTLVGVTAVIAGSLWPDGRPRVTLRLREFQPIRPTVRVASVGEHARTRIRRPRRGARIAVIVTTVTGVAAGLLAVAAYLFGQLVELIAEHAALILGVLALAAILAAATARRGSGHRHCPGC